MDALRNASDEQGLLRQIVIALFKRQEEWESRPDSVELYDPSHRYEQGQVVALPYREQDGNFDLWKIVTVKVVHDDENPVQGRFQVVEFEGERQKRVAGVDGAKVPSLRLPKEEELEQAAEKVVEQYRSDFERRLPFISKRCWEALDEFLQDAKACSTEEVMQALQEKGFLGNWSEPTQRAVTEWLLRKECVQISEGWISRKQAEKLGLGRKVKRRPDVPIIRDDQREQNLGEIEEEAEAEIEQELVTYYAEELSERRTDPMITMSLQDWRNLPPPRGPMKLPPLTYQHIVEAYFPLTNELSCFFPPGKYVGIKIVCMNKTLQFWVNREDKTLKALDRDREQFTQTLREHGIPAGTYLWLERIDEFRYRLFPRTLTQPKTVKAKLIRLDEQRRLCCEEIDFLMRYEGNPYLVVAELRLEDLQALWAEAEQAGMSILQAMCKAFQQIDPEGKGVHHTELFNAVFFRIRSCSPKTVLSLLSRYQCFEALGNGRWRYLPHKPKIRKSSELRPTIRIVGLPEIVFVGQRCEFTVRARQMQIIAIFAILRGGPLKEIEWKHLTQEDVDIPVSLTFEQEGSWVVLAVGIMGKSKGYDLKGYDLKEVNVVSLLPRPVRWALDAMYNQGLVNIVDSWLKGLGVQGLEAIKQRYRRERT
jgi:hypothetical protein